MPWNRRGSTCRRNVPGRSSVKRGLSRFLWQDATKWDCPFGPPRASARPSPADVAGQSRAAGPYDDLAGMILAQVPAGSPAALGFTSVDECAGRSEMVALLAAALARREPRDVLAVNADFRRPPVSGSTHLGLAGVLDGRIAWEEAITETGIPSLFTLSAGCTDSGTDANGFPANGSPLSERLAPLLEPWRGRFRLVLIETPSLIWPESVRLARYFQSVYLAVRLGQTSSGPCATPSRPSRPPADAWQARSS